MHRVTITILDNAEFHRVGTLSGVPNGDLAVEHSANQGVGIFLVVLQANNWMFRTQYVQRKIGIFWNYKFVVRNCSRGLCNDMYRLPKCMNGWSG